MSDEQEKLASKFRRLVELREARDEAKTLLKTAEDDYREYEAEVWSEMVEGPIEGSISLNLGGDIGRVQFTPRETKYGRVIDAEAALKFFEERDMAEEFTAAHIEKAKLNEFVRDLLEQGQPLPDGIDFYAQRGVTISRK